MSSLFQILYDFIVPKRIKNSVVKHCVRSGKLIRVLVSGRTEKSYICDEETRV